jgi:hypothetical protein
VIARKAVSGISVAPNARRLTEFPDKFGHKDSVILRDSAIPTNSRIDVNALIVADFDRIRAKSRDAWGVPQSGILRKGDIVDGKW